MHRLPWRYLIVIVIGFGVDFMVSMILARLVHMALVYAAGLGFLSGLVVNYMFFEFWAFGRKGSGVSASRFLKTVLSGVMALSTRLGVVLVLGLMLSRGFLADGFIFGTAAVVSAAVNFILLSKVFREKTTITDGS